ELEYTAAAFDHARGIGVHHHILRHRCIAANFEFRAPLQLNEAHPTITVDAQLGVIAVVWNGNTSLVRRLDNTLVVAAGNFLAVNSQVFCHCLVLSSGPSMRRCSIWAPHSATSTDRLRPG